MMRSVYTSAQSKNIELIKDYLLEKKFHHIPKDAKERVILFFNLYNIINKTV
jgi:hypothetical protein